MTFQHATDRLCLSAAELAEIFDRPVQTIRQMRLDVGHPNYRRPPPGWEQVLAAIARTKSADLAAMADELDPPAPAGAA